MRVERLIDSFGRRAALPGSVLLLAAFYLRHWLLRVSGRRQQGLELARKTYADI